MAEDIKFEASSVGVAERAWDRSLTLTFNRFEGGDVVTCTVTLPASQARSLMIAVVNHASGVMESVAGEWVHGDCGTCGNLRLVTVERHGQPWRETCPDCGNDPRRPMVDFPSAASAAAAKREADRG